MLGARAARRFLALSSTDRWLLVQAFLGLAAVEVALRTVGFGRLVAWVGAGPATTGFIPRAEDLRRAQRYAGWLERASRHHFVRARCLHRALALHQWLRRDGLPSELRIGVRKENDELLAHAWVELGTHAVNERHDVVATFRLLSAAGEVGGIGAFVPDRGDRQLSAAAADAAPHDDHRAGSGRKRLGSLRARAGGEALATAPPHG